MAQLQSLPRQVYAAGDYVIPSVNIPNGVSRVNIGLERHSWPDTGADVIQAGLEVSYDNGQTWAPVASITAGGGDIFYKGVLATESVLSIPLQPGNQRRLRGHATLFVALDTAVNVRTE